MDKTGKPLDLFVKLSPRSALALANHLVGFGASYRGFTGKAALGMAWQSLSESARQGLEPALLRIQDLSCRQARAYVLDHVREARRDSCAAVARVLEAVSTPDLAVRLYLDDPAALERAHFQYATALLEQIALYQGQYIADVIPSRDRRARMLRALHAVSAPDHFKPPHEVLDCVNDDRFVIALHRAAHLAMSRRFDGAQQLDPNLCQPEIERAILFRFDSSLLIVRAEDRLQREALRDAFVQVFVGDPHYFEVRREHRTRFKLTIDPVMVAPAARPSLVKAVTRAKPSRVGSKEGLRSIYPR